MDSKKALNNVTTEILFQMTAASIAYKNTDLSVISISMCVLPSVETDRPKAQKAVMIRTLKQMMDAQVTVK